MERQGVQNSARPRKDNKQDVKGIDPYSLKSQEQPLSPSTIEKPDSSIGRRKISHRMSNGDLQTKDKKESGRLKYKSKEVKSKYENKNISISNLGDNYTTKSNGECSTSNLQNDYVQGAQVT